MKRLLFILLVFFSTFTIIQKEAVNAACDGVGNYCVGSVVQQFPDGCFKDQYTGICSQNWTSADIYNCSMDTCTREFLGDTFGGTCNTSTCTSTQPSSITLSCCLYGGASGGGGGCGSCDTTAPSNLSADWGYSATQARFSWTPGQGLSRENQYFAISETLTDLEQPTNCNPDAGANCIIFEPLSIYDSSYIADKSPDFTPGTTYAWGVISIADPLSCSKRTLAFTTYPIPTVTPTPFPCTSGFNVSCAGSGAQATISWNAISGAAAYFCRGRS